jgi:predicted nucleic acid-binding protein
MSVVVLDTNILLRLANPAAPEHEICRNAVTRLAEAGTTLATAPQVLVEFWVVATRPTDVNGLGWAPSAARTTIDGFLGQFRLLVETREAFDRWRALVTDTEIRGKRAHDARIAAVMLAGGVTELLTLNTADFDRIPGLVARNPATVTP